MDLRCACFHSSFYDSSALAGYNKRMSIITNIIHKKIPFRTNERGFLILKKKKQELHHSAHSSAHAAHIGHSTTTFFFFNV